MTKSNTSVTIRTDKDVKEKAQQILSGLGMDMTTAVNMFLRQMILHNGLPFDATLNGPNRETLAAIREVQLMKEDPSVGKSYTDVDEMMEELLA